MFLVWRPVLSRLIGLAKLHYGILKQADAGFG